MRNVDKKLAELAEERLRLKAEIPRLQRERNELKQIPQPRKTPQEYIDEVWDMPELPENYFDGLTLPGQGFATGSAVYSDAEPADLDFVVNVPPTVYEGYGVNTQDDGYWESDGMTVVYAHYNGKLLNIICVSDYDNFKAWQQATEIMRSLYVNYSLLGLHRKWARVRVFRALRDVRYPVKPRHIWLELSEAIKYNKCLRCGREAINFIDKRHKEMWQEDALCDRCREA